MNIAWTEFIWGFAAATVVWFGLLEWRMGVFSDLIKQTGRDIKAWVKRKFENW